MLKQQKIFFDFLRFCIGSVKEIPDSLKDADWKELYAIAKKQALIGVLFHGIKQLPKELSPDAGLLMQWMGMAQKIRQQNIRLFLDSAKVCKKFKQVGFRNCILKGQGNALLYPAPYMRTPGDIDIYLDGGRNRVMQYINKVCPNQVMRYHHVDFPVMKTAIEVHFTPSYMFFPVHNRRMQKWFKEVMDLQCSNVVTLPDGYGEITVPTTSFNVIYILSHLYRHVFTEGIGLRQLIDYYFILVKSEERRVKNLTALQRELKYLGLWKFTKAVMYVLHETLGLPEENMIAPIDVNEGRFLLAEIMQGGNFGQYDTRLGSKENEGKLHRYFRMNLRNLRFVKHYPTEALSEPLFRTWFALWKKIHRIR
ncbi:nucleotidyltransferase domain-containing protein [Segatella copri]|uniref:Nucleotidyltransferase family protein n=1 Tax=Segatella copri TaxID=165179 RepID=A0A6G1VLM1_9BACT|nr:nucleotidyltransferase family protein [Segatella copri]MQN58781.1 nucleotidyltransferase family protein [Segatella copri]MQP13922.1 nucleotidyltransferase family protein [Segatella copri]